MPRILPAQQQCWKKVEHVNKDWVGQDTSSEVVSVIGPFLGNKHPCFFAAKWQKFWLENMRKTLVITEGILRGSTTIYVISIRTSHLASFPMFQNFPCILHSWALTFRASPWPAGHDAGIPADARLSSWTNGKRNYARPVKRFSGIDILTLIKWKLSESLILKIK